MSTETQVGPQSDSLSIEQKRERILIAATEVFANVGYNGADVQEIADRSEVGKGTIYRYFLSKENLFWECGVRVFHLLEAAIERSVEEGVGPLERLERVVIASGEIFYNHPDFVSIVMQTRFAKKRIPEKLEKYLQHKFFTPILALFQDAIDQGLIPPGNPLDYNISVMDAIWGVTVFHRVGDDTQTLTDRLKFTLRIILDGLRSKPDNGAILPK